MKRKILAILLSFLLPITQSYAGTIEFNFTNDDDNGSQESDIAGTSSDNVTIIHNVTNENIPVTVEAISTDSGTLSITNTAGTMQVDGIATTTGDLTINNSGTIEGNLSDLSITPSTGLAQITNNAGGTIAGDIAIYTASSGSFLTNRGTITGNVQIDSGQTFNLYDGSISGTIDGGGNLNIGESGQSPVTITAANDIGGSASLNIVTINDGHRLDASTNGIAITATSIRLGSESILDINRDTVSGAIDGVSSGDGTVNLGSSVTSISSSNPIGTTNAVEAINILDGASISVTNDIAATTTTIGQGSSSTSLSLGNSNTITGNVVLTDSSQISLGNSSSVTGAISASTDGDGIVTIAENATYQTQGNIGSSSKKVNLIQVLSGATLNAATNNNAIFVDSGLVISNGASLNLGTGSVTGAIGGENDGDGTVNINDNNALAGNLGSSSNALSSVVIAANKTLTAGSSNIDTNNITLNSGSVLSVGTGTVVGAIDGSSAGDGTVAYGSSHTITSANQVGATNAVGAVTVADGATLDVDVSIAANTLTVGGGTSGDLDLNNGSTLTGNLALSAGATADLSSSSTVSGTVSLGDSSVLTVNSGVTTGLINGASAGDGTIAYTASHTISSTNKVGATNAVEAITVADGATLTVNDDIAATTTTVGEGTSGILNLASSKTITGNVIIGDSGAVSVSGSTAETVVIVIGGSDIVHPGLAAGAISGTVGLSTGSSLTLNDGSSVGGAITTDVDGEGDLIINGTVETAANIGTSADLALNSIAISASGTLNAATNNNAIFADLITIGSSGFLTLGTGSVTGTVQGLTNGVGTVNINDDNTLAGALGTSSNSLASVTVAANKTLTANTNNIDATNITINSGSILTSTTGTITGNVSVGGTLNIGSGSVAGTIDGSSSGVGILNINDNNTLAGNIGETNSLSNINIAANKTLTANTYNINATTTTLNSGSALTVTSGILSGTIQGASNEVGQVNLNVGISGANLGANLGSSGNALDTISISGSLSTNNKNLHAANIIVNSGSSISLTEGVINGTIKGGGAVSIATDRTLTNNLGTSSSELFRVVINEDTTLNANDQDIFASSAIVLKSDSILNITTGTMNGVISAESAGSAVGTINFNDDNSLTNNVGLSSTKLLAVNIAAGKTLTIGSNEIHASNVTLSSDSTLSIGSGSVNGAIDGDSVGDGTISYTGSSTTNGNIGETKSLSEINITSGAALDAATNSNDIFAEAINLASGSTFTVGGEVTGNVTLSGGTINFGNTSRVITGNLTGGGNSIFMFGTATHTVSGDATFASGDTININIADASTSGGMEVDGIINLSSGTNLSITTDITTIVGNAKDYIVLSGGAGTSLNQIADSNINLNGSGSNSDSNLSYSTFVSSDTLLLRVTVSDTPATVATPSFLGGSTTSLGSAFSAGVNAQNAQGELATIKTYLTNNAGNQRLIETAVKSFTPNDKGVNQNNRNTINSSLTNIQTRLTSIRGNPSSGAKGFKAVDSSGSLIKISKLKQYASAKTTASDTSYLDSLKNKNVWGQFIANHAKQDNKNGVDGYSSKLFGFSFGIDTKPSDTLTVGISATIASSQIDSSGKNKRTDVDSYQLIAYSEKMLKKQIFLRGFVGTSFNNYDSKRYSSVIAKTAEAKYSGQSYFTRLSVGRNYELEENFTLSPEIATNLTYDTVEDYSESGARTANLNVQNKNYSMIELEPSFLISKKIETSKGIFEPNIKLAYAYNFASNPKASSANFVGQTASFQSQAAKIERGTIRLNTGLSFHDDGAFLITTNYVLEKRESFESHGALIKLDWKF